MCVGIALAASELPLEMLQQPRMQARLHSRGGEAELRFFFRDAERLLPIIHDGSLRLVRWGARRSESAVLPPTGWTWLSSVENPGTLCASNLMRHQVFCFPRGSQMSITPLGRIA